MGNEESRPVDPEGPPQTLKARTLEALAEYVKSGSIKRIVFMVGAGISTSAGIPDFRSPDTGLYANLARLDLPYPEAVFDMSFFRNNPLPFYTLAHELYPGKYRPTLAHSFIRLVSNKGLLLKCFTQNIDCLEREAGVPDSAIVEAHGSFARQRCIECKTEFPDDEMRAMVERKEVPHCRVPQCNGLVKPDIVFFGEQLPEEFFRTMRLPAVADLAIVMGSSLKVHPFAMLPGIVPQGVPRVLINREPVGNLGSSPDDVLLLGDCDDGVRKLAEALGWWEELEKLWREVNPDAELREREVVPKDKDEALNAEIDQLTKEVDESLRFSNEHTKWVSQHLEKDKDADSEQKVEGQSSRFSNEHTSQHLETKNERGADCEPKPRDGTGKASELGEPNAETPKVVNDGLAEGEKPEESKAQGSETSLEHVYPHMDPQKPSL